MIDPYENLACAIILQAVKDYRAARKKLKHNPKNKDAKLMAEDLERFFRSDWYTSLTSFDGEMLLTKLKEEEIS
ncbi:hypothetical protein [Megasphaera vaginalis (ex Srinivasan et al. 2021)]|uniref:Uncharacterized protein n=1 Tax=Megasphaera vaginalis (ex Srinivasan et al. 2021) TaxID=1111454 RepID=U7UE65_9FIRM|nr:hypothetical protein [Megasphaera vaginalis (ex Srinivasan et al. 2021)]ERT57149.1 hypothetical protein HMPREF1250_1737 [Megasphaera vaginalis (ex Srinivasan et al. 2021)]